MKDSDGMQQGTRLMPVPLSSLLTAYGMCPSLSSILDIRTEADCHVQGDTMVSPKINWPVICILHEKNLKIQGRSFFLKMPFSWWGMGPGLSQQLCIEKCVFAFDGADWCPFSSLLPASWETNKQKTPLKLLVENLFPLHISFHFCYYETEVPLCLLSA